MKKRVIDGEVKEEGTNDVLTKVLGKPEHSRQVCGQGSGVKQLIYFDLLRKKGKSIDEKIQEGIQKFMTEETSRIVQERDAFWAKEKEKIRASLCGKTIGTNV